LALFGKKKGASEGEGGGSAGAKAASSDPFESDPVKAKKFFDHAQAVHDTTNYAYSTVLWLQGIRQDPSSMYGLERFFDSVRSFASLEGRDKPTKEQASNFGGKGPVENYLGDLLNWGTRPDDAGRVLRVLESAKKLELSEHGYWIAEKSLPLLLGSKKKDVLVKLKDALVKLGAFDLAVKAGEAALMADPSDAGLEQEMRNIAAQATMNSGGYGQTGVAGGFRANIRGADAQRKLEEESSIVKSEETIDRLVEDAKADYERRPDDRNSIGKYARILQERGRPEDVKISYEVLMDAYKKTDEFRFRQQAGELRMKFARRQLMRLRDAAEKDPASDAAKKLREAQQKFTAMEMEEYKLRSLNYPTDLGLKYELGVRHFRLGNDEEAIALFQEAQHDAKHRTRVLNYLGQSFRRMGWNAEAADTFKRALDGLEMDGDELGLEIRYGLMDALAQQAEDARDLAAAEEAYKIGSGIAMQQISYRDIRARRDRMQQLMKELKGA
jgi:tetratricopeptide (TPR) repeat protein